jgi:hypothetical protein
MARLFMEIEKANTDLVGENTSLQERIRGTRLFFYACFSSIFVFYQLTLALVSTDLKDDLMAAQTTS